MKTINDFLKFKYSCPMCEDELSLMPHIYGEYGTIKLNETTDNTGFYVFRRLIKKRIIDGGGTDYVVDTFLHKDHNFVSLKFYPDLYSHQFKEPPKKVVDHFNQYRSKIFNMISNSCKYCDYEYSAIINIDYDNLSFTVKDISNEVFSITTYTQDMCFYVVNNLIDNNSQVVFLKGKIDRLSYPINHWLIKLSGSFCSIPTDRSRIEFPDYYIDPAETEKNIKEFKTLFLFS